MNSRVDVTLKKIMKRMDLIIDQNKKNPEETLFRKFDLTKHIDKANKLVEIDPHDER